MSDWLRLHALVGDLQAEIAALKARLGIHPEVEAVIAESEPPVKAEEPAADPMNAPEPAV